MLTHFLVGNSLTHNISNGLYYSLLFVNSFISFRRFLIQFNLKMQIFKRFTSDNNLLCFILVKLYYLENYLMIVSVKEITYFFKKAILGKILPIVMFNDKKY